MTNHFVLFTGTRAQTLIAAEIFERVSCLVYNKRPVKTYNHKEGLVVEYSDMNGKFEAFYQAALRRLYIEPDYNGKMPRRVVPK